MNHFRMLLVNIGHSKESDGQVQTTGFVCILFRFSTGMQRGTPVVLPVQTQYITCLCELFKFLKYVLKIKMIVK